MRLVSVYAAWMVAVFLARLSELISKTVFESLVVLGVTLMVAASYKKMREFDYKWERSYGENRV